MTTIKTIPVERLSGLDVAEGDTLRILSMKDAAVVVQISRDEASTTRVAGNASLWVKSARGSVRQASGESVDEMRMGYYARKHGIK